MPILLLLMGFSEFHDQVDSFPVFLGVRSFVLTLLAAIRCWMVGATPSVSLPGLGFDRWWKHPLVFQSFKLAAKIKAFAGKRKGKMLGKGLSYFGPWVCAHFFVPQVAAAGCAAAAVVVVVWYFQGISSLSAAAFLACALISYFAFGVLFLFTSGNVMVLFAMMAGSSRLEVILLKGNGKMLECFLVSALCSLVL